MRSGRLGAVAILALALIGYLRRRVWWSYSGVGRPDDFARPAFVARQPAERRPYVARVTPDWRPIVGGALPALLTDLLATGPDTLVPAVWLDASERPDVGDLPRVTREEPLRALTQWLYDAAAHAVVLVVAVVEPVTCSFAVVFDAQRHARPLERAAEAEQLVFVFERPRGDLGFISSAGKLLFLPLDAPAQLRAVLAEALRVEN